MAEPIRSSALQGTAVEEASTLDARHARDDGTGSEPLDEIILTPSDMSTVVVPGDNALVTAATELSEPDAPDTYVSNARLQAVALPPERLQAGKKSATPHRQFAFPRTGRGLLQGVLFVPAMLVLAAMLWASVVAASSLVALVHRLISLQFAEAVDQLPSLDAAGRVVLASVGYFALFLSLRALASGMRANGWQRLQMLLAVVVALPSAWLFVAGAGLVGVAPPFGSLPSDIWRAVVLVLLVQVIALAVVTTQQPIRVPFTAETARPSSRRFRRQSRHVTLDATMGPMPMVRFGPPPNEPAPVDADIPAFRVSGLLTNPPLRQREESPGGR